MKQIATHGIFIGRFQPIHDGHVAALKHAADQVQNLIIFVGSSNVTRSIKNPWTFAERYGMIDYKLRSAGVDNFTIIPLNDYRYSDAQWVADVKTACAKFGLVNPVMFGSMKDGNDYLTWFPEFKFRNIEQQESGISATSVRNRMFAERDVMMPQTVQDDYDYYQKEAAQFAHYPYPETLNFNCADAILECNHHILLIERKFSPGRGSMALPGGFKNRTETFFDCAIRELIEETNVRVPEKVLRGSVVSTRLFDDPNRSFGIPRNTLAVHIRIKPDGDGSLRQSLPRANGADDAASVAWVPTHEVLNSVPMYDDHKDIISTMLGVVPSPAF